MYLVNNKFINLNHIDPKKKEIYKSVLQSHREKILEKISILNNEYATSTVKSEKINIGREIDNLELELEKVDYNLVTFFCDKDIMSYNILSYKEDIDKTEFLLKTNQLPKCYNDKLLSKKLDLANYINETLLHMSFVISDSSINNQPQIITTQPQIVEVEKYIEIPTLIGVDKVVEVPKIVEVEKIVEVPKIIETEKGIVSENIINENISEKFSAVVNDSVDKLTSDLNELITNKFSDTNLEINTLKNDLLNLSGEIQSIKETKPIYVETPVLIQQPYHNEQQNQLVDNQYDYYNNPNNTQYYDNNQVDDSYYNYDFDQAYYQPQQDEYNQQQVRTEEEYYAQPIDPPVVEAVQYESQQNNAFGQEVNENNQYSSNPEPFVTQQEMVETYDEYEDDDYFDDDDDDFDAAFD